MKRDGNTEEIAKAAVFLAFEARIRPEQSSLSMEAGRSFEAWDLINGRGARRTSFLRMRTRSGRARQAPLVCRGARPRSGWARRSARPGCAAQLKSQSKVNSKAGQRAAPARLIPVPEDLDAVTVALVGTPYSTFWNLNPPDDAAWRGIATRAAEATFRDFPNSARLLAYRCQRSCWVES